MPAALCLALLAALTWLVADMAHALPELPESMQEAAAIPCLPHCTLCHRDENGGAQTVDRPFGESFVAAGGTHNHREALATLTAERTDSDGDGAIDVDELAAGSDPNTAYEATLCGPSVGCGIADERAHDGTLSLFLLLMLVTLARRRTSLR